ncbi:MAG TPA: GGDEF domain-containing protein [Methylibium sp.]|nr:GGDEF domain-containing protein [Methylibium sp.]
MLRSLWHALRRPAAPDAPQAHGGDFFRGLVEAGELNLLVVGSDHMVRYASPNCIAMLGRDPSGERCETLVSDEVLGHLDRLLGGAADRRAASEAREVEFRLADARGGPARLRVRFVSLLHLPAVRGVLLSFVDMSAAHERIAGLARLAVVDALTGLRNRLALDEVLPLTLGPGRETWPRAAVAFIDIDHFGRYNKLHTDAGGDEALRRIAQALQHSLRDTDLLFRKGGEEFVALLPDVDPLAAAAAAERLRASVEALAIPHAGSASAPVLTVTVGVASGAAAMSVETLMKQAADLVMAAKLDGRRNRVLVGPPA